MRRGRETSDLVIAEQYPGHGAPWHPPLGRVDLTTDVIRLAVPPAASPWGDVREIDDAAPAPWVMEPTGGASRHLAADDQGRSRGEDPARRIMVPGSR